MKILALTSIRSEYDLMSPLFFELQKDNKCQLKLIVGGAHNSPSFGFTVKDIRSDGFDILLEVDSLLDTDSASARIKGASILLLSIVDVVKNFNPDLIIYAGDREEVMVGALLGSYLSIPTLHFFGGDHASDGHVDNPLRHAVSKMSTCHFVSTEEHRQRLIHLGEPDFRIFVIGSVALDKFKSVPKLSNIIQKVTGKQIIKPIALVIFHPIKEELPNLKSIVSSIINELIDFGYHVCVGLPNSDPGNLEIRNTFIETGANNENVTLYGSLPRNEFVNLFKESNIIVGNSSAGLLEAASIPIPCINVGLRQRGRAASQNVIFVDAEPEKIRQALLQVNTQKFRNMLLTLENIYGDGNSAKTACQLINEIDFKSILLKKEDPLNNDL